MNGFSIFVDPDCSTTVRFDQSGASATPLASEEDIQKCLGCDQWLHYRLFYKDPLVTTTKRMRKCPSCREKDRVKSAASAAKRKAAAPPLARKRPATEIEEVEDEEFGSQPLREIGLNVNTGTKSSFNQDESVRPPRS